MFVEVIQCVLQETNVDIHPHTLDLMLLKVLQVGPLYYSMAVDVS
jgi:hypothetical protein